MDVILSEGDECGESGEGDSDADGYEREWGRLCLSKMTLKGRNL